MMDKYHLTPDGNIPTLLNFSAVEYNIRDILGKMIRDDINGDAVLKY
jgi:hypothetical protein